eukprot:gene5259-5494_t
MAQPYAGYGGYGYPSAYGQGAYAYGSYPSAYAAQQPASYDSASYSAWYGQQQHTQQPSNAPAPPPLPAEPPPPLPSDPAPPADDHNPPAPSAEASSAATGAVHGYALAAPSSTGEQQQAPASGTAQPQQYASGTQYASYYQYPQYDSSYHGYSYASCGQQPSYSSYQSYSSQYPGSSTNIHVSQVNSSAASNTTTVSAQTAATAAAKASVPSARTPAAVAPSAAGTGSNATPIGGGTPASAGQSAAVEAMKAAAAAVASRLTATKGQVPAYVQVGTSTAATANAAAAAADKDALPTSLQQYVARALSLLGRTPESRQELRTTLRDLIAQQKKNGTLWSTDWDREPLPVLSSQHNSSAALTITSFNSKHQQGHSPDSQRKGGVWDRLGSSRMEERGSRKRGRYQDYDTDHSSSSSGADCSEEEDYSGRHNKYQKKGVVRGQQQQQQQQPGKKGKKGKHKQWKLSAEDAARQVARSARFSGQPGKSSSLAAYGWDEDSLAPGEGCEFIVGTSQTLEKRYFRLTRAPLPEEVRPQPVLERALQRLMAMIVGQQDKYLYYNDQFKAMRQDLTVQGIKNAFTVKVYEAHARAALEYGDGAEYNQCQTQLAILYAAGLPGSHAEFGGYRLLYQSVHAAAGEGRRLLGTMKQLLGNKVGQVADSPEIQHAMQVRAALFTSDASRFFQLYAAAPRLSRRLMDVAVKAVRWQALNTLVRAHKPGPVPLMFLATNLGFLPKPVAHQPGAGGAAAGDASGAVVQQLAALTVDERGQLLPGCSERSCLGDHAPAADQQQGLAACLEWAEAHGAVVDQTADLSSCALVTKECWSKLFVPEDTTKVAHGDVNLDIRDFLALDPLVGGRVGRQFGYDIGVHVCGVGEGAGDALNVLWHIGSAMQWGRATVMLADVLHAVDVRKPKKAAGLQRTTPTAVT